MAKVLSLIFILLVIGAASAANFGSTTKGDYISIDQGQNAKFTLLFWNSAANAETVHLETASVPENWVATFSRNDFPLSNADGNEMISSGGSYVRASSVDINLDTKNSPAGLYNVTVSAKSYSNSDDITFAQERTFNLKVKINGVSDVTAGQKNILPGTQKNLTGVQNTNNSNSDSSYIYYLVVFIIILGAVVIYKRS